jgi:mannosyltransferase
VQFFVGRMGPEWVRRLPSVIAGVATVALIMILGRIWFSAGAGLAAGLFMAMSPMHIRYSQEVRPYSLALCLICASLLALEIYATNHRRAYALAWCALVFLAGSTLYFAGMIAATTGIFRIFIDRDDRLRALWRRLPLIILVWVVLYAPWLDVVRHAAKIPSPEPADTLDRWWWQYRLQSLGTGNENVRESVNLGSWLFWLAVVTGVVRSVRVRLLRVASFMLIAGTAMEVVVLQIHPHFSTVRYLLPSWPAAFILAGAGVAFVGRHWATRPVAGALLAIYVGYSAIKIGDYYRSERSEWRDIALYVHSRVKPGDRVIAANTWVMRNFGYYWRRLPRFADVPVDRYFQFNDDTAGPVWIVSAQCTPRSALLSTGLMQRFPQTEAAEVRYVRPGQRVSMREELCPE